VQKGIPRKRNLLYEMLLKLSGVEKRIALSEEEINNVIDAIRVVYVPFLTSFSKFLQKFIGYIHSYFKENINLQNIASEPILTSAYQSIKSFEFEDEDLQKEQISLMELIGNRLQILEKSKPIKEERELSQDIEQKLQYLLINLNNTDKKLTKFSLTKKDDSLEDFDSFIIEVRSILDLISNFDISTGDIEDLTACIKNLNARLKYKKASFSFALISRNFKLGTIPLQKFLDLLKTKIRAEIIRAAIVWTLKTFGALTLEQIEEKTNIKAEELLENCITLLDRKEITVNTIKHVHYYDVIREYPKLYRFISNGMQTLKKLLNTNTVLSSSLLNATLSISNEILEKILKAGPEIDKIYDDVVQNLSEPLKNLNKFIEPRNHSQKGRDTDRIAALIELYQMFRVKMVHEKEPYLIDRSTDERKQEQLDNFLLNALGIDFERGLLLYFLKNKGPLDIRDLAQLSRLPQKTVVQHILKLVRDKAVITKGMKDEYYLYDVPRTLTKFEKSFQDISIPFVHSIQSFIHLPRNVALNLEHIPLISTHLRNMTEDFTKLQDIQLDPQIESEIRSQLEQMNTILNKCNQLEESLPKTKSKFDLTKLAMVSLPRTDEKYANLIEPQYLVGFGDIEWDINKCLSCKACQEVCPETAVSLLNEWDLPTTFEMPEEELEKLPENRKKLIELIKKLAVKKPSKSIKLPKNTLGFGKIKYDPLICIACKKCEERCPNSALTFHEYWNFPQIMKTLLEEG